MKTFGILALMMVIILGVVAMGYAYSAVDYEASNKTGNMTETTNTTLTSYSVQYAWWGIVAFIMVILAVFFVFSKFVK